MYTTSIILNIRSTACCCPELRLARFTLSSMIPLSLFHLRYEFEDLPLDIIMFSTMSNSNNAAVRNESTVQFPSRSRLSESCMVDT